MVYAAKQLFKNGRKLFKAFGDRGIERHFQKIDHFRCAPTKKLSDFVLMRGYKVFMEEIENEANSNVRHLLMNNLIEIETELKRRNILDEIHSF